MSNPNPNPCITIVIEERMINLIRFDFKGDRVLSLKAYAALCDRPKETLEVWTTGKINVNYIRNDGTMLSAAMEYDEMNVMDWLIATFPLLDINMLLPTGATAAQHAARCCKFKCAIRLLDTSCDKFDPYVKNAAGETLVSYAITFCQGEFMLKLVACKKDLNPSDEEVKRIKEKLENPEYLQKLERRGLECFELGLRDREAGRTRALEFLAS